MLDLVVKCEKAREGCEWKGEIRSLDQHKQDCPLMVFHCRYSEAGCEIELPRRELKEHENDLKFHLQVITKYSHDKITALQNDVDKLTAALRNILKNNLITFKITEYRKKRNDNIVFRSPSFYTSSEGYKMEIVVCTNGKKDGLGTHISVYVKLLKGDYDDKLKWPFTGEVKIKLLNQLEDADHHKRILDISPEKDIRVGSEEGYSKFISQTALGSSYEYNTQYLKKNTLYFRVSVWTKDNKPWLHCTV